MTQNTNAQDTSIETDVTRRELLKTGAGAGAAGAVLAVGGTPLSPTQDTEAIPIVVPVAGAIFAAAAGAYVESKFGVFSDNVDPDKIANQAQANEIHGRAQAIEGQRASIRNDIKSNYVDPKPDQTQFADFAWQESETAAAEAVANNNKASAKTEALNALDKRYTMAVYTAVQRWNRVWIGGENADGLLGALVADKSVNNSQFGIIGNAVYFEPRPKASDPMNGSSRLSVLDDSELQAPDKYPDGDGNGNYIMAKYEVSSTAPPANLGNVEGIQKMEIFYPLVERPITGANNIQYIYGPNPNNNDIPQWLPETSVRGISGDSISVTHPSRQTATPLNAGLFSKYFQSLKKTYDTLSNQIPGYVENTFVPAIETGEIDPSNYLSGQQIIEDFSSATGLKRVVAEAIALGYNAPEQMDTQVKINHPDLATERWGNLFLRTATGTDPPTVQEGGSILAEDYQSALFAYTTADTSRLQTKILSGTGTIQILKVEGGSSLNYTTNPQGRPPKPAEVSPQQLTQLQNSYESLRDEIEKQQGGGGSLFGGAFSDGIPDWAKLGGLGVLGLGVLNALN
jgi:hypothetical protein